MCHAGSGISTRGQVRPAGTAERLCGPLRGQSQNEDHLDRRLLIGRVVRFQPISRPLFVSSSSRHDAAGWRDLPPTQLHVVKLTTQCNLKVKM